MLTLLPLLILNTSSFGSYLQQIFPNRSTSLMKCNDFLEGDNLFNITINRRQALASALAFSLISFSRPVHAAIENSGDPSFIPTSTLLDSSRIYEIKTDSTPKAAPSINRLSSNKLIRIIRSKRAIFLGEHHPDTRDHLLQAALIHRLYYATGKTTLAVGLEAIQRKFQPALDDYIAGRIDEGQLIVATDWERRWYWSFKAYASVFRTCRALGVKIVALDVDSEDKGKIERGGLSSLDNTKLQEYVPDEKAFEKFGATMAFHEYVSQTLKPPYNLQKKLGEKMTKSGTPEKTITFSSFLARQMLRDEGMASASAAWLTQNPDGLLLGIVGTNHAKFGCGVAARLAQALPGGLDEVTSVLLNPTPFNTEADLRRCDGTFVANEVCIRNDIEVQNYVLQLGYMKSQNISYIEESRLEMQVKKDSSVLALSDYVIFSPNT